MSVANLQAAAGCLNIVLPMSLLSFLLALKAHSIGMDMLLEVHHHKALTFRAHVTRALNMESILLKKLMQGLLLSIYLMQEIQVSNTLCILKQENSNVMIPSPEYGMPLDNMKVGLVEISTFPIVKLIWVKKQQVKV